MGQLTPDETLLGLLAVQPQHGYQLLEHFRGPAPLAQVWNLSTSQLYAVLKRLCQQGLITGHEVESANAPTRTEYHLTGQGQARLWAWLDQEHPSASMRHIRVEFLSRLYIARLLNAPTASVVTRQKIACQARLAALLDQRKQSEPGVGLLTIELFIAQLRATMQWLDRCEIIPHDSGEHEPS